MGIGAWVRVSGLAGGLACAGCIDVNAQIERGRQAAADTVSELTRVDRITTVLCGTASPLAAGATQSCTAVFVNGQFLLFDVGDGAVASMTASNLPLDQLDGVFITHFHNDHYADLAEVVEWSWVNGRTERLAVHGPTGLTPIVEGFEAAYALERTYRTEHHGDDLMPLDAAPSYPVEFPLPPLGEAAMVYEHDGVVVTAFPVGHAPVDPAVGYRIEYGGKSVVITGDTVLTDTLQAQSAGADLLVSEVMNMAAVEAIEDGVAATGDERAATLLFDIRDYHMDVADVGRLASEAGVGQLVLTHLAPHVTNDAQLRRLYRDPISDHYDGPITVGKDGMVVVVDVP